MPPSPGQDPTSHKGGVRLGGVRADFVANLGKRIAELRQFRDGLVEDPTSPRLRDEFRRHLHALATRARVLHFEAMAERLERAERRLERTSATGSVDPADIDGFDELLRELPSLAWSEVGEQPAAPAPASSQVPKSAFPYSVLVIGRSPLARSLQTEADDGPEFDVETTEALDTALELTQALAPDVVVLDGDMAGAIIVSETLARDAITRSTPVIVVGTWAQPDQAAGFLAHGVSRALPKPVTPAKLRQAVRDATGSTHQVEPVTDLGAVTVEELANRLAEQVRAGLVDAVRPESRRVSIDLDKGTEVLAAVWSAVARVREMLTIRSQGAIRFDNTGPVGAVPVAPWLDIKSDDTSRRDAGGRETAKDANLLLENRRVLVVDDDPAVTWFLSGLFRSHGSIVQEAHDGAKGLTQAFRFNPDLVITDILMPELDGFALCRALKRDILLRDVPVIVLSWKEDLLQRVRELGVGADGYLRKEATSAAILRTVQESLRPRTRIEQRLRAGGDVRGRLDGLTAYTLLSLASSALPNAAVTVRDAQHLFEVHMRDGRVRDATRTALDGSTVRGNEALVSLVRVFTGRFHVAADDRPIDASTDESLHELVAPAVAQARAAQSLLESSQMNAVASVQLRLDRIALESLPEPTQAIYGALANGTAPRTIIAEGLTSAAALEQLLSHAATRGAVAAVVDENGNDLLIAASKHQLQISLSPLGVRREKRPAKPPVIHDEPADIASQIELAETTSEASNESSGLDSAATDPPVPPPTPTPKPTEAPTSLEEAVIREVADASGSIVPPSDSSPAMLDASELRPRSSARPEAVPLPSLPPDAIVPATESIAPDADGEPSVPSVPSLPPLDVASMLPIEASTESETMRDNSKNATNQASPDAESAERDAEPEHGDDEVNNHDDEVADKHDDEVDDFERAMPREVVPGSSEAPDYVLPARSHLTPVLLALALGGALVAAGWYFGRSDKSSTQAPSASSSFVPPTPASTAGHAVAFPTTEEPDGSAAAGSRIETGLPIDTRPIPADQGLVEVITGRPDATVSIDGHDLGEGEDGVVTMFLPPGKHRVSVLWQTKQEHHVVEVAIGERTRLSLEDAWDP